jgi:hypothetical protein
LGTLAAHLEHDVIDHDGMDLRVKETWRRVRGNWCILKHDIVDHYGGIFVGGKMVKMVPRFAEEQPLGAEDCG